MPMVLGATLLGAKVLPWLLQVSAFFQWLGQVQVRPLEMPDQA